MTDEDSPHWYIATLIIASRVENSLEERTCDEQIRLIRALDAEAAYEKALSIGKDEECSYQNVYGETIIWEFVGLENLEVLDTSIHDGVEIRSRLLGHQNPSSLVRPKSDLSVFAAQHNPHSTEYK